MQPRDTQGDEEQPNSYAKLHVLSDRKSALLEDIDEEAKDMPQAPQNFSKFEKQPTSSMKHSRRPF